MQDRVSLYPGRVKLEPVAGQANLYDLTRADSPTQEGTPLNKATLLKDTTAALYGLSADAVPDDAFSLLSRFQKGLGNEYLWEKTTPEDVPRYTEQDQADPNQTLGQFNTPVYYSDSFTVSGSDFVLTNPSTVTPPPGNITSLDVLKGKYFIVNATSGRILSKMPVTASVVETPYGWGLSARVTYTDAYIETVATSYGYVNSPDPNAYPPAVSDGYTYIAQGQVGITTQIATGRYTGTGTYGSSNPNSLTFDFEPKMVIIWRTSSPSSSYGLRPSASSTAWDYSIFYVKGQNKCSTRSGNTDYVQEVSVSGNTFFWYTSSNTAGGQLNESGVTYRYFVIG